MKYSSAEEVLCTLTQAYYEKRDIETTLSCVTDDVEWIGTEELAIMKSNHIDLVKNRLRIIV